MEPAGADKDTDIQNAMEAAYASESQGDAYSQSIQPPDPSAFSGGGGGGDGQTPPARMNAEESATLQSFLAGGEESGEGVVIDWSYVMPLVQAVLIALAITLAGIALGTHDWRHGTTPAGVPVNVGLKSARPQGDAGLYKLKDLCGGAVPPGTLTPAPSAADEAGDNETKTGGNSTAKPPPPSPSPPPLAPGAVLAPSAACALRSAGGTTVALVATALACLALLLALNLWSAFATSGALAPLAPLVARVEARLSQVPDAVLKLAPTVGWALSLALLASAMVVYGANAPAQIGGGVSLPGLSYGTLRLSLLCVLLGAGVHCTALSEVWRTGFIAGVSIAVAKWRALADPKGRGLAGVLAASLALHLCLWVRGVSWAVTLPLLGAAAVLFKSTSMAMAYVVLGFVAAVFALLDLLSRAAFFPGEGWLALVDLVALAVDLAALAGTLYLRIVLAHVSH